MVRFRGLSGSLALTLFGYFLSMVLDRVCYLVRSPGLKLGWHFSVVAIPALYRLCTLCIVGCIEF